MLLLLKAAALNLLSLVYFIGLSLAALARRLWEETEESGVLFFE